MSKRNLLNLALLTLISLLAGLIIFEPGKQVAKTPSKLTNLESQNIKHIKIKRYNENNKEQLLEFQRTTFGWKMLKPYKVSANTFRIDSILEILSSISFSQNDLKELNINTFGLNKPVASITFNNTPIIFGHNKSLKNYRYLQIGSTLHMSNDTYFYKLIAKAESYIDHKIINTQSKIVKFIAPNIQLEKIKGSWKLNSKRDDYTADSANQLIDEWKLSQAYDVNKIKAAPKGKADILIYLENNEVIKFKIEKNIDSFNLINLNLGVRYILPNDRREKLLTLNNNFQDNE